MFSSQVIKSDQNIFFGAYSNPGTQMVAQNKDFGAVSQTDLTRV